MSPHDNPNYYPPPPSRNLAPRAEPARQAFSQIVIEINHLTTEAIKREVWLAGVEGYELVAADNGLLFFKRPIDASEFPENQPRSRSRATPGSEAGGG